MLLLVIKMKELLGDFVCFLKTNKSCEIQKKSVFIKKNSTVVGLFLPFLKEDTKLFHFNVSVEEEKKKVYQHCYIVISGG